RPAEVADLAVPRGEQRQLPVQDGGRDRAHPAAVPDAPRDPRLPRRGPRTRAARAGGAGLIRIPIRRFRLSSRATGEGSAERQISPRIESGVGMTVAPCVWTRIRMTTRRKEKGRLAPALFRFCAWSEASGAIAVPRAGASAAAALGRGVRVRT